jgi:hypothetical protein
MEKRIFKEVRRNQMNQLCKKLCYIGRTVSILISKKLDDLQSQMEVNQVLEKINFELDHHLTRLYFDF